MPVNKNRAKRAHAKQPLKSVFRTFHRIVSVQLNQVNPNGGTYGAYSLNDTLDSYASAAQAVDQYEQYRVKRTRVYAVVDPSNAGESPFTSPLDAIEAQAKMYASYNSTTCEKYLDYDSTTTALNDFLKRDSLTFRGLPGAKYTLLGNYVPRMKDNTGNNLIIPANTWVTTEDATNFFLGLKTLFKCRYDGWSDAAGENLQISLMVVSDFEFKGLKSN